jgi:RNA recognition motif-containing protein
VTKLYVGNLSFSFTDESLLQMFQEKGYSPVSARIVTDKFSGQSRGFAFVELGPNDDAAKAIGEFNGANVGGRNLTVNEARPQEPRAGGGGGRGFGGGGGRGGDRGGDRGGRGRDGGGRGGRGRY